MLVKLVSMAVFSVVPLSRDLLRDGTVELSAVDLQAWPFDRQNRPELLAFKMETGLEKHTWRSGLDDAGSLAPTTSVTRGVLATSPLSGSAKLGFDLEPTSSLGDRSIHAGEMDLSSRR